MPASRRMTYHFTKPGRYLVSFGNRLARGRAGFSYLLRIAPADAAVVAEERPFLGEAAASGDLFEDRRRAGRGASAG